MTLKQKITVWLACTIGILFLISALSTDPFVFWPIMGRLALFALVVGAIYGLLIIAILPIMIRFGLADPQMNPWPDIKKGFKKRL